MALSVFHFISPALAEPPQFSQVPSPRDCAGFILRAPPQAVCLVYGTAGCMNGDGECPGAHWALKQDQQTGYTSAFGKQWQMCSILEYYISVSITISTNV